MSENNGCSVTLGAAGGFGSSLAMIISYAANHSILWAIMHGILSWLFVIYAAIAYP